MAMAYTTVNRSFLRHYAEMVAAMLLGMATLGMGADMALGLGEGSPALVNMGLSMTIPMVAWMRFRGHGWAPCAEMAAAMLLPTAIAIAAFEAGADYGAVMLFEHVVMFAAMFAVMLLRPEEYSH